MLFEVLLYTSKLDHRVIAPRLYLKVFSVWSTITPSLIRITVARNTVSQPADTKSSSKTIKSFVVVRPSKSTGSFRPKSNATSTAEFLSINSDFKVGVTIYLGGL